MGLFQKRPTLDYAELRNTKWFILFFYIILVSYDSFYYYIYPKYVLGRETDGLHAATVGSYIVLFMLYPIAQYLLENDRQFIVKYMYFICYIILNSLNDLIIFTDEPGVYRSGNAVEVFIILFSPIFVNVRYFWTVTIGTLVKYACIGVVMHASDVTGAIVLLFVLSGIAYMLLNRFLGYVSAVKDSYDKQLAGIVKGIVATLELKDPYTRGHSERVAAYALSLAEETGLFTKEELKSFHYACLLHDIGKIHIPDHILVKPSRLTDDEFSIIQTHPAVGAEAVKKVEGLEGSADIVCFHHERWDGNGYPNRLQGEGIPFPARIVSIADAFDAMTSSRSYRSALSVEEAYRRIVEGQGNQFDPNLVEVFKRVYPVWTKYHSECFQPDKHLA